MTSRKSAVEPVAGAEGLKLLLAGDRDRGLASYKKTFRSDHLPDVPIGLHLLFLERAGQRSEAKALLKLAIDEGANVAVKSGGFGAPPAEAAAEYEDLFESGVVNSRMVFDYLIALSRLGRFDDLARWLDWPRLLRDVRIHQQGAGASGDLASKVEKLLFAMEQEAVEQEAVQSVRNMRMIKRFHAIDSPVVSDLCSALTKESRSYLEAWACSDHPLARFVPRDFHIMSWALISRGQGYNVPHVHHQGWATGVYYPAPVSGGGQLHVGKPTAGEGLPEQWGARSFAPEAGRLVLMPSFYTHWTVPLDRPGVRTAVAFDLLPGDTEAAEPAPAIQGGW